MRDEEAMEIRMLPVYAGDATLIISRQSGQQHTVLIDTGKGANEALHYLLSMGIRHLDLIIISHADMDHVGGLRVIMDSDDIGIDRLWCFDLNFLRSFIVNGVLPDPEPGTHQVLYRAALFSTLDEFDRALRKAQVNGVQIYQVSEGHRIVLGNLLLEVLYPSDRFYQNLRHPAALKRMLSRRAWPVAWGEELDERADGPREDIPSETREITADDREIILTERLNGEERAMVARNDPESNDYETGADDTGTMLATSDELDDPDNQRPQDDDDGEKMPWRRIGTLYNNMSLVVRVTALGGIRSPTALFTGDLSDWSSLIRRYGSELKSDILKVPHHGSAKVGFDPYMAEAGHHLSRLLQEMQAMGTSPRSAWRELYFRFHDYDDVWPWLGQSWPWRWEQGRQIDWASLSAADATAVCGLVDPDYLMVFPYPTHKLPTLALSPLRGTVVANRKSTADVDLPLTANETHPAGLIAGVERSTIQVVPSMVLR